jgi:hypothetical protein
VNKEFIKHSVKVEGAVSELGKEVKTYDEQFNRVWETLNQKIDQADGKRIWDYFTRFAEYQDLKDLYNKVIPEIGKFETKLLDYYTHI